MSEIYNVPDVSDHRGKIDWPKVKGRYRGAIIRIGYGDNLRSQDDVYAAYNLSECERLGIPYMAYLYSYANSLSHIQSEVEHMKRMCAGYNPLAFILDIEEWRYKDFAREAAEFWMKRFPDKGIIYAGQSYWKGPLKGFEATRWIPAYGTNSGKPEPKYKPPYDMTGGGWQYTSRGSVAGIKGNVDLSEWYGTQFDGKVTKAVSEESRPVLKKEVAALIMMHLCAHDTHGYTQDMKGRQGTGYEVIDILGHEYRIPGGDRDCSSAVISAYEAAGISCGGATYTGNMAQCMTATGNFVVRPMSFIAQMADSYLVHDTKRGRCHTAMCLSAEPDVLMEFSGNEKGGVKGGKTGDQLQKGEYDTSYGSGESHLRLYYDYPWDCILQCVNEEVAFWTGEKAAASESPCTEKTTKAGNPSEKSAGTQPEPKNGISVAVKAAETILGDYGNGNVRRQKLGKDYTAVQGVVEDIVKNHRDDLIATMAAFIAGTEGI